MIFDLSALNPTERAIIEQALVRCREYNFDQIAPNYRADTGRAFIRVQFKPLDSLGRATYQDGLIELRDSLVAEPEVAGATFLHEAAHFAAVYALTEGQWRQVLEAIDFPSPPPTTGWFIDRPDADYWASQIEAFANGFVDAFSNYNAEDYGYLYRSSPRIAKHIRDIVGPPIFAS